MAAPSPFSTPKRKREQMLADQIPDFPSPTQRQFTFSPSSSTDGGSMSPRSCVAHRFRGLALEPSGGGVFHSRDGTSSARNSSGSPPDSGSSGSAMDTSSSSDMDIDTTEGGSRKRARFGEVVMLDAGSQPAAITRDAEQQQTRSNRRDKPQLSPKSLRFAIDTAVVEQSETIANTHTTASSTTETAASFAVTLPSRTKPTTKKSRSRNITPQPQAQQQLPLPNARLTSLPILAPKPPTGTTADATAAPKQTTVITDPLRASLTWHDDEITIYDPDDSDDDGTGINGIGFKPTAAVAYARTVKRKQQMAEYRKREEREARARRSQRRRRGESPALSVSGSGPDVKKKVERRRVRFSDRGPDVKVAV